MKIVFLYVFLLINLYSIGQIDDSLNTLNLQNFPHFTEVIHEADDIEIENLKQKGKARVLLFKTLYIQKHQGTWLYDSDSCSIKQIRTTKMAYFSTGTQAIYCGLSFDVGVKERKFLRSAS